MSKTPSIMIPLGTMLPSFILTDVVTDKFVGDDFLKDHIAVVMFICNHCPYVKHVNNELVRLSNDYIPKGVRFVAISSNDVINYPDDAPEKMKDVAKQLNYPFPYLYDETQQVAHAFDAACTPDFYVFNKDGALAYRGQLDDSRPSLDIPVTGNDLRAALNSLIEGQAVSDFQRPSIGCNIKWKR